MRRALATGAGRVAVIVTLTAALFTGCLADGPCSTMSAASESCAAGVEYEGHFYAAWTVKLPVAKGRLLGDGTYPACDDGSGCGADEPDTTGRPTKVWAMRGVDPDQVVIAREQGTGRLVVHGRLHADADDYFRFAGGTWHIRRVPGDAE